MIPRDGIALVRMARRVRADLAQRARYAHTLGVARTARHIARATGVDEARALTAGLLHDLARLWDRDRLLRACAEHQLTVDDFEARNPVVLHARVSAVLAREHYGVDDAAVLSAIAKHTVGAEAMSPLDETVYLADSIEPGRRFAERAELAALALRDRRAAMRAVIANATAYLRASGAEVAPATYAMARGYDLDLTREPASLGGSSTG